MSEEMSTKIRGFLQYALFDEGGRTVLRDILLLCGVGTDTFRENPQVSAYLQGRQSVGQALQDLLMDASPDDFCKLLREVTHGHRSDTDK